MTRLFRLLKWAVFAALLGAVAIGVFPFVRYRPRCVIEGPLRAVYLSADGSHLLTHMVTGSGRGPSSRRGPLQVWDAHTGRLTKEFLDNIEIDEIRYGSQRQHVAFILRDSTIVLLDTHFQEARLIQDVKRTKKLRFSPSERWLVASTVDNAHAIINVDNHQVSLRAQGFIHGFDRDEKLFFVRDTSDAPVRVLDLAAARQIAELPSEVRNLQAAPKGNKHFVWMNTNPAADLEPAPKTSNGIEQHVWPRGIYQWDLAAGLSGLFLPIPQGRDRRIVASADGKSLATWYCHQLETHHLEMLATESGSQRWRFALEGGHIGNYPGVFSKNSSLFYIVHGQKTKMLTMFEAATGSVLWEKPSEGTAYFAGDTGVLLHFAHKASSIEILDARTGATLGAPPPNFTTTDHGRGFLYQPSLTRDCRYFSIGGWLERKRQPTPIEEWLDAWWPGAVGDDVNGTMIMETATGRPLLHLRGFGDVRWVALSDDGSTVIAAHYDRGSDAASIRVWDVHPTKARLWSLGSAVVAGLALFCVRRGWQKWRRRAVALSVHASSHLDNPPFTGSN